MKLSDYMREKGLRDRQMGAMVGLSESQISRIRRGLSVPSRHKFPEFIKATGGKVTPNDFADISFTDAAEQVQHIAQKVL